MKNGFKIFDTGTHLAPSAKTLRPFLASKVIERGPDLEEHRVPIRSNRVGKPMEPPFEHLYRFRGGGMDESGGWGSQTPRYLG